MYEPRPIPVNPSRDEFVRYVAEELQKIAQSQADTVDFVQLNVLNREPKKPRNGMVACADGVNWNPTGAGAGVYEYVGGAWAKL